MYLKMFEGLTLLTDFIHKKTLPRSKVHGSHSRSIAPGHNWLCHMNITTVPLAITIKFPGRPFGGLDCWQSFGCKITNWTQQN